MARGVGWSGLAMLDKYLKNGFADLIDVYSFHRYHVHPELARPCDFTALRATFAEYGKPHMKLWQAESGCPSQSSPTQALRNTPLNEKIQAKVLLRSILTDLAANLDYTCYFHFSDFKFYYRNGLIETPNYFGLITFDNPPKKKKSYHALQNICAFFDDQTRISPRTVVNFSYDGMEGSKEKYVFQERIINAKTTCFERRGAPLACWWLPANLLPSHSNDDPFMETTVNIHIWSPLGPIKDPVMIDPLSGDVFDVAVSYEQPPGENTIPETILSGVILKDYPMIAAERSAVGDMISRSSSMRKTTTKPSSRY